MHRGDNKVRAGTVIPMVMKDKEQRDRNNKEKGQDQCEKDKVHVDWNNKEKGQVTSMGQEGQDEGEQEHQGQRTGETGSSKDK
jgi:hypothetical protein